MKIAGKIIRMITLFRSPFDVNGLIMNKNPPDCLPKYKPIQTIDFTKLTHETLLYEFYNDDSVYIKLYAM